MSDKDLLKNRFAANLRSYNSLAVVQERICEELAELIGTHVPGKSPGVWKWVPERAS